MISSARSFRTSLPKIVLGLIALAAVGCSSPKSSDPGTAGGAGSMMGGSTTGLLLWLKLDEASTNGAVVDSSANMNMVTYGAVKPVVVSTVPPAIKAFSNAALKFDGTSTVDIARSEALNWGANESNYTISLWANVMTLPAPEWGSVISNNAGGSNGYCGIAIGAPDGNWSFESNGQDVQSMSVSVRGTAPKVGTWQHIAIVQNGTLSTNTIYVDGVPSTAVRGSSPCNSSAGFSIGAKDGDKFVGMVDDVRIYGNALTEAQVKELFQGKENITL